MRADTKPKARRNTRPKGGHCEGRGLCSIFLLTGLRIYTGEYKAQGPTFNARPKGGHYEGRGLCIRLYRYASQLVRSLLPD